MPARAVITRLRREMALAADPKKAVGMQAYMKSTMPYYGLNLPAVRRVSRQLFGDMEMGCHEWRGTHLGLLGGARPPQERYPALFLPPLKRSPGRLPPGPLHLLREEGRPRPR